MKETLHIKNFGPIKDVKLDLGKVNVLIGDQGTGKSTVAKIIAVFYSLLDIIDTNDLSEDLFKKKINIEFIQKLFNDFRIANYSSSDTEINYTNQFYYLKILANLAVIEFHKESDYQLYIINNGNLPENSIYIPSERHLVSMVSESNYVFSENKIELPGFFSKFGRLFQSYRQYQDFDFQNLIGIKHLFTGNDLKVTTLTGKQILLTESSSAIQSSLPLLVVFDKAIKFLLSKYSKDFEWNLSSQKYITVIEEMELNCFPETQQKLIKYLIEKITFKYLDENFHIISKLLLTTHSPYILTSLNNLMYAYSVGQNHKEKVSEIIEEKYWLNPNDVSAYMMLADGTCEDIMDREEGMIKAEKIDEVSNVLSEQFDELMNIEHNFKKHEL